MASSKQAVFFFVGIMVFLPMITGCDRQWEGDISGKITEYDFSSNENEGGIEVVIPIAGALITTESMKNGYMISTTSGVDGTYRITDARWGPNRVFVYHPRYETVTKYTDVIRDKSVSLDFEMDIKPDRVTPEITVFVINANGDPIGGARIDFYEKSTDYYENYFFRGNVITDAQGLAEYDGNLFYENDIRFYQMRLAAPGYFNRNYDFTLAWWNPNPEVQVTMEFID